MEREKILELRLVVQQFTKLFGLLEQSVTPCGFPLSVSQVLTLQELEKEILTVNELSKRISLERSSVSRLVDNLVKSEFVQREINEENRREVILSLTSRGMNAVQQVRERSVEFYKKVLDGLEEREQEKIFEGFQLFTHSLSKERDE